MEEPLLSPAICAAALYDVAYAIAIGALLAKVWLARDRSLPLLRLLRICLAVMALMLTAQIWIMTSSMSGLTEFLAVARMIPEVATGTHAGRVWIVEAVAACVTLFIALFPAPRKSLRWEIIIGTLLCLLGAAKATSGHAAAANNLLLAEGAQWVHLLSTAVWSGCVIVSGLMVVPLLSRQAVPMEVFECGCRLSRAATWALIAVVLSGIVNSYLGLGGALSPLVHSQWGRILLFKVAVVLSVVGLGAINRWLLHEPSAWDEARMRHLAKALSVEALLMILILVVSASLANHSIPS